MTTDLEQRVTNIEAELSELRKSLPISSPETSPKSDWRALLGTFDDDPAFEEILQEGKKFRDSQIPDYDSVPIR